MANLIDRSQQIVAALDAAVLDHPGAPCSAVKRVLEDAVNRGEQFLEPALLKPASESYARRLWHRDPSGRYEVLVMVWDRDQGTLLHDHAGLWCVECVYRGRILVQSYDLVRQDGDRYWFTPGPEVVAGVGEAGALIPPLDYHTLRNMDDVPAVTVHVYGGHMDHCDAFEPGPGPEGGHRKVRRTLCLTP